MIIDSTKTGKLIYKMYGFSIEINLSDIFVEDINKIYCMDLLKYTHKIMEVKLNDLKKERSPNKKWELEYFIEKWTDNKFSFKITPIFKLL